MGLSEETVRSTLQRLPGGLDELRAALTLAEGSAPRPWLPALPDDIGAHHALWSEVVSVVEPFAASTQLDVALAALKVLACCPIEAAGAAALRALASGDTVVRLSAQDALAVSGHPQARKELLELLADPFSLVRFRAAGNLGVLGDPTVVPALRALFEADTDSLVQRWAAISLGDLGGEAERVFLENSVPNLTDPLARDGVRRALESLGAGARPDLHPEPAFARAVLAAEKGDQSGLEWLLDHYEHPALGLSVHLAWRALPDSVVGSIAPLATKPRRRFAAADIFGWRGVGDLDALRGWEQDMDVAVCLAASTALIRRGEGASIDEYWLRRFPPLDRLAATRALHLEPAVPVEIVKLLLFEPCGLLPRFGAELVRRDGGAESQALLRDALALESRRLRGDEAARPPDENDSDAFSDSVLATWVRRGDAVRSFLPPEVQEAARALEVEGLKDPHVAAAHGLLLGLRGWDVESAREQLKPWLGAESPLLRFWALALWVAAEPSLPAPMHEDADATVRALWNAIATRG